MNHLCESISIMYGLSDVSHDIIEVCSTLSGHQNWLHVLEYCHRTPEQHLHNKMVISNQLINQDLR